MVISGGTQRSLGPIVGAAIVVIMKNVVSAYIVRWNLVLGLIFVVIISFMPEGLVPGSTRLLRWALAAPCSAGRRRRPRESGHDARSSSAARQIVRRPAGHQGVDLAVAPGERRLIIGPNGAGKTTLFNLITGEIAPDDGSIALFGRDITAYAVPAARASRHGTHLPDHHVVSARHHPAQRHPGAARAVEAALESVPRARPLSTVSSTRARAALVRVGLDDIAERPLGETSYGERRRVEIAMAMAQEPKLLLLDEPFAGLSIDERRDVRELLRTIPRAVTIVMIEHNMDVALDFADRITLLHFGEIIVEGPAPRSSTIPAPGRCILADERPPLTRHRRLLRR